MSADGAEMGKALKRSIIVVLLLVLSICIGYTADSMAKKKQREEYVIEYSSFVEKYAQMYDVEREVVYAVIKTESGFDSNAKSSKGAVGLMQLIPDTFKWVCEKEGIEYDEAKMTDPELNIRCGTYYLAYCKREFAIWETAYAAYNAGVRQVKLWLDDDEISENGHLINIPFSETKKYVQKVANAREIYERILKENEKNGEVTGQGVA